MMLILVNNKDYYTIVGGEIVKTKFDIKNAFNDRELTNISRDKFKSYTPCRFVIFNADGNRYNNITYNIDYNNAFILLDVTSISMDNIRLKYDHKMLVSNDLVIWDNYYDGKVSSTITIKDFDNKIDNIKKYLRLQSKPINFINKKYNYILLQLNNGETFNRLCEILYADYKRFDFETDIVFSSGIDKKISITPTFNTKEIIVKLMPKDSITIQNSIGAW